MKKLRLWFFIPILLISFPKISKAQLSFPNGTVLNLNTNVSVLYFETEILFHTGKYLVNSYDWVKISDSLDNRWLLSSCFNGDCWNDLPQRGGFVKEYGFNDTTGFIRFHVDTKELNGKSVVRYKVVNRLDTFDQANLIFNIVYLNPNSVDFKMGTHPEFSVVLSSDGNFISLQNMPQETKSARILNTDGKQVLFFSEKENVMFLGNLPVGIYFVELKSPANICFKKFVRF